MKSNSTKKLNVFLIDDSVVESFLSQHVLEEIDHIESIVQFNRADSALEYLVDPSNENNLPDLILLDIEMPRIDGFEFLDELAESERFPKKYPFKIFLLTNSKKVRDREKFERELDVIQFIRKPLEKDHFEAVLIKSFGFS